MANKPSLRFNKLTLACTVGLLFGSAQVLAAEGPFSPTSTYMLGDWGGERTALKDDGVDFQVNYTGEAGSNFAGGYDTNTTARYSDQWQFGVDLDLDKLLNWKDTEFQMTVTNRNGRNISNDAVGDPRTSTLSSSQEVWGRGQTTRLTQFWIRQGYFDDTLDIKAGRVTVGEDFDSLKSNFQNLALGSGQAGNWRGDRWYNWPVSQWGGRIKLNLSPEYYAQVGIYNQNPKNYDTGNGFRLDTSNSIGNLIPLEFGWLPKLGPEELPGKYALGAYYSSTKGNVYSSGEIQNGAMTYSDEAHSYGGYLLVQQQLTSVNGNKDRGLSLTVQAVMNDKKTSSTDNYQSVALTYMGLFDGRPKDEIGFGVGRIHVNDDFTQTQRDQNNANGVNNYSNPTYLPVQSGAEYNYELYYGIRATEWMTIRPNLQYIAAPGAVSQVKDAFVGGVTVNVAL
ncbi:carbohydrate porin [Rouxiella chamberiensis]|uniref:Carbohydrate porin n=1 Tax=Rouxiella chamberiensis TaxID=1513468 RepID=A0ABY7HPM9_9GAMM|nr:carbohydrate porin [Rouxiella chamberiensis]WAT00977.1 carbohydrate porin [Rouxiella chamberiensis]